MNKYLIWLALCLAFALRAHAVDRHTMTVVVSNLPVTGNNLSFSAPASKVITWSNVTSSAWVATNTTRAGCATNLYLQIAAYAPWTPRPALQWMNATSFTITAECGDVITVTNSGTWAVLSFDTNDCAKLLDVRVPVSAEKFATTRVYIASMVLKALNDYPTNAVDTNAAAFVNYVSLGPHPQTVLGTKTFNKMIGTNAGIIYGGTNKFGTIQNAVSIGGVLGSVTNGYGTNNIWDVPITTNLVNYGNAISSPGPSYALNAEQFGASASATNTYATAIGQLALAGGAGSIAVGQGSRATNSAAMALGVGSIADFQSIAIGDEAYALTTNAIAIGSSAQAIHQHSFAIGHGALTTQEGQGVLGSASVHLIRAPGRISAGSYTNNIFTGTNRNEGAWGDIPVTLTSLANGNNVLAPGNYKVIRLAASGPTASFSINSIQGGWNGRQIEIWNDTGQALTVAHESGYDATNVNRIITSGADVVFGTNVYVTFRYFTDRNRWKLTSSRE